MAVKIRLKRIGAKKKPYYRIVVADARFPRDGRFIEQIGTYDPMTNPAKITVDGGKALQWIKNGAQPTDRVKALLAKTGALEKARDEELNKAAAGEAYAGDVDDAGVEAVAEAGTEVEADAVVTADVEAETADVAETADTVETVDTVDAIETVETVDTLAADDVEDTADAPEAESSVVDAAEAETADTETPLGGQDAGEE